MSTLAARFWKKVQKGADCWEWIGSRDVKNYGRIAVDGKSKKASRICWEIHNGPIPLGLLVLHKCDNPPCVNPDHLFLGTNFDNMQDASKKGRCGLQRHPEITRGSRHPMAKLHETHIPAIRKMLSDGMKQREIGKMFGVGADHISQIKNGRRWKHVPA